MPKIKKKEMERLKMARTSKSENLNISVGAFLDEAKKPMFVAIDPKTGKKVGEFKNKREADAAKKKNRKLDIITMKDYAMMTEAKFKADVEGIGTIYVDGGSASGVKAQLKKVVKKGDLIKSVDRIQKGEYKKELRALMKGDEDKGEVDEIARSMTPMKDKFGSGKKKLKLKDFKVGMFVQGKGGKVGKITANEPRGDQIVVNGTSPQGTNKLTVNGATYIDGALAVTGAITSEGDITAFSSSDKELKDNITNIEDALAKVESVNGVKYTWNDKSDLEGDDVGVIAQEIEDILPEVVATRNDGYKAVRYEKLVPLLIEAVKELSEKVKKLEGGK